MASTLARALPLLVATALLPACNSPAPREVTPWAQSFAAAGSVQTLGAAHHDGRENRSFGVLTTTEWNNLYAKHLEHHLQQFGV